MDLTDDLADLRAERESGMVDTCLITRAAPSTGDVDPVTGLPGGSARTVVYGPDSQPHRGKCRVRTAGSVSAGMLRQSAGDMATIVTPILSIPVSAPRIQVDDRVEIVSSANPNLPALVFTVSGLIPGSQVTSQRVAMTAVID